MKFKEMLLLSMLFPSVVFAQTQAFSFPTGSVYKAGSFVIKGHLKNTKDTIFDFELSDFIGRELNSVKVKSDGSFQQRFPIRYRQDAFFFNNIDSSSFTFTLMDKDTVYIEWDKNEFKNSFVIRGKNAKRTAQLQEQLRVDKEFSKPFLNLEILIGENRKIFDNDKKFDLINDLYNKNVHAVLDPLKKFNENEAYLITSLYFKYSNLLRFNDLMPAYELKLKLDSAKTYPFFNTAGIKWNYQYLNELWFYNVPQYRDFIFYYIAWGHPFDYQIPIPNNNKLELSNFTWDECYRALSLIYIKSIQEWFITNSIISGFGTYDFAGVEKIYKQFIPLIQDSFLKDTLQQFYTAMKRLKSGNPAPGFSLQNEQGKTVSLSDFRGKVVYIDFWGVGCGPCILDITNHVPSLHKKYKDKNVVFVNICVDSNEDDWKKGLLKYKLDGINLIAEGWTKNPVCRAYNVNAIPHYILIDKKGNIADNNAVRASELNGNPYQNEIDLLLK